MSLFSYNKYEKLQNEKKKLETKQLKELLQKTRKGRRDKDRVCNYKNRVASFVSDQMTARTPVVFADAFEDANRKFIKDKTMAAKDSDLFYKHVSLKPDDDIYAKQFKDARKSQPNGLPSRDPRDAAFVGAVPKTSSDAKRQLAVQQTQRSFNDLGGSSMRTHSHNHSRMNFGMPPKLSPTRKLEAVNTLACSPFYPPVAHLTKNVTGQLTNRPFKHGNSSLEDCSIAKNTSFTGEPYPAHPSVSFARMMREDSVGKKDLRLSSDYMWLKSREQRDKIYDLRNIQPKKLKPVKLALGDDKAQAKMGAPSQLSEVTVPKSERRLTRIQNQNKDLRNVSKELHNKTHFKGAQSFLNNNSQVSNYGDGSVNEAIKHAITTRSDLNRINQFQMQRFMRGSQFVRQIQSSQQSLKSHRLAQSQAFQSGTLALDRSIEHVGNLNNTNNSFLLDASVQQTDGDALDMTQLAENNKLQLDQLNDKASQRYQPNIDIDFNDFEPIIKSVLRSSNVVRRKHLNLQTTENEMANQIRQMSSDQFSFVKKRN